MSIVGPLLPALVPLTTLLWLRAADHSVSISRGSWELEYDYIIGEWRRPKGAHARAGAPRPGAPVRWRAHN